MYVGNRRLFKFKLLADFFEKTGPFSSKFWEKTRFTDYLCARNLITETDFSRMIQDDEVNPLPIDEYENPLQKNTLEYAIYHDNVSMFVSLAAMKYIDNDLSSILVEVNGCIFTPLNLACYCSSLNIMKFLLLNNVRKTNNFYVYAVYSGSEEAIEFLISQGFDFNYCLLPSIQYHYNQISKWLFEKYQKESYSIANCMIHFNTEMLIFLLNQIVFQGNYVIDDRISSIYWNTQLFSSIAQNNQDIIAEKYLCAIHKEILSKIKHS